ncbi:MAG: hypothetical protein ACTJGT_00460 [Microbacteriaceae bacterium]
MTLLGTEVHAQLAKTWDALELSRVEQILTDSGIVDRSNSGVPVQLHITRVAFSGEKSLVMSDGGDAVSLPDDDADRSRIKVPFEFDWSPAAGVNGVGSEKNLRGKSSVLKVISWALVGRSPLRADVEQWISSVAVEFTIDGTTFAVRFNAANGIPNGNLVQCLSAGSGKDTQLGSFTSADEFEVLMNSFMLERLRLEDLSVWAKDKMQPHAWPSYAGALNFFADQLDPLIGNIQSLSTRLLQMFAGTSWAPTVGQVNAALGRFGYESDLAAEEALAGIEFAKTQREDAETRVERAQSKLDAMPTSGPDVASVFALLSQANDSARAAHNLELQLMTARGLLDDAHTRVQAELARRQATTEDKLARKFFNSMHPTECPRCSSKVTDEHREAEYADHECSLCHAGLDLAAFEEQILVSTDVSSDELARLRHAAKEGTNLNDDDDDDDDDSGVVDVLVALKQVAADARQSVEKIEADLADAKTDELDTATSATAAAEGLAAAKERQQAEIELARAQGALEALMVPLGDDEQDRENELTGAVLRTAKSIVGKWLKADQDPILELISEEIAQLAHQFGIGNLERVSLKGNANMTVRTGGVDEGYASISGGERIRLKIATAIALMGSAEGRSYRCQDVPRSVRRS